MVAIYYFFSVYFDFYADYLQVAVRGFHFLYAYIHVLLYSIPFQNYAE